MKDVRIPRRPGWYARFRGGRIDWFEVLEIERPGSARARLMIFDAATERFIAIGWYCGPLTRWAGPVELPWVVT